MSPSTEFFLIRVFPHSERIRRDTKYLSVFSSNAGKYGPEKTPYLDTFQAAYVVDFHNSVALNSTKGFQEAKIYKKM